MISVEILHLGGTFSQRLLDYLSSFGGDVTATQLPDALPMIVDYPRDFLPSTVGSADVTIAVNIHQDLLVELPCVISERGGQALIAPREDPNWMRPGLVRQVASACDEMGVEWASPELFCTLEPTTSVIAEFCRQHQVGPHKLELVISDGVVTEVEYLQGAPCGLTRWVAERLVGIEASEPLMEQAKTLHHARPCLASMNMLPDMEDTLLHKSLYLFVDRIRQALRAAQRSIASGR